MTEELDHKKVETIRDTDKIGRSFINMLNGLLAVVLTAIAGTVDTDNEESNVLLRNLSISFGATITGLQLILAFGIDTMVSKYTFGQEQEDLVKKMLESPTPAGKIQKGNEMLGKVIVEIKKVKNEMNDSDKKKFTDQIDALEAAYGPLGTGLN